MGKFIVGLLAVCAAFGLIVHFVGQQSMGNTAVTVPGTMHTPGFGLTWGLVCAGALAIACWRIMKGK